MGKVQVKKKKAENSLAAKKKESPELKKLSISSGNSPKERNSQREPTKDALIYISGGAGSYGGEKNLREGDRELRRTKGVRRFIAQGLAVKSKGRFWNIDPKDLKQEHQKID